MPYGAGRGKAGILRLLAGQSGIATQSKHDCTKHENHLLTGRRIGPPLATLAERWDVSDMEALLPTTYDQTLAAVKQLESPLKAQSLILTSNNAG